MTSDGLPNQVVIPEEEVVRPAPPAAPEPPPPPPPLPRPDASVAGDAAREGASGDLGAELGDHLGELFEEANELSERVQELERLAAQVIASPDCVLIAC
jgi:hypothetical protein